MKLKALQRWKERQAEGQLDARGLSIRDHYRKHHASLAKKLQEQGEEAQFFLERQESYHQTAERLSKQTFPAGGAEEILRELYYPLSDEETRILRS
jgi:hypothetical protein